MSRSLERGAGFSLAELLAVLAICGLLVAVGAPMVLGYYYNTQNTTGAQQIRTLLNQARKMALDSRDFVCVQVASPTQMAFYLGSTCTGTPWTGAITDAAGHIGLLPGFTVSASSDLVFDYLGLALPTATYTVTNATTGSTLTVSVATSGRITIP